MKSENEQKKVGQNILCEKLGLIGNPFLCKKTGESESQHEARMVAARERLQRIVQFSRSDMTNFFSEGDDLFNAVR